MTSSRWLTLTLSTGMLALVCGRVVDEWAVWLLALVVSACVAGVWVQCLRGR